MNKENILDLDTYYTETRAKLLTAASNLDSALYGCQFSRLDDMREVKEVLTHSALDTILDALDLLDDFMRHEEQRSIQA